MLLNLNEEDLKMLKQEMKYIRCMYWDGKLKKPEGYCNGNCHSCNNEMTIDKFIESKKVKE